MDTAPADLLARLGFDPGRARFEELPHNRWLTPGVWRARTGDGMDAVLKYVTSTRDRGESAWDAHWTADDHQPGRWTYWARETLFYRDGLAAAFEGMGSPECLGAHLDEREAVLLTSFAGGQPGDTWPLDAYGQAALAIGRSQGPFLAGRAIPEIPWLSRRYLRDYSTEKPVDWSLIDDDEVWGLPVAKAHLPDGLRPALNSLHANRERLYRIHDALPPTLCHLDFWPRNLFLAGDGTVTAIDWSFVGVGSVGEDVGNLVPDASFDHFVAAADLPALEEIVLDGYLRGLREGGWSGDERLVQLGMWASAVKYDWLAPHTLASLKNDRHQVYGGVDVDPGVHLSERGRALQFNAGWAQQALDLAARLGL